MSDLVLRTCTAELTSYQGFQWPSSGPVECKDWDEKPECGNGLHGLLWGEGDGELLDCGENAKWLVVQIESHIKIGGKVKFRSGTVVCCGDQLTATGYLIEHGGFGKAVVGSTLTGGNGSTLTGGNGSTLTGGNDSTLTSGHDSTMTGGHDSTLTGGNGSTLTGGNGSTLTGGHGSTLTGGAYSMLTGGSCSTLTGGHGSTLTGGRDSTLTGGHGSTLTGGHGSTLQIHFWDSRQRIATAYVGESGIKPDVQYRLNADHKFVEVEE